VKWDQVNIVNPIQHCNSDDDWNAYRRIKNSVNSKIKIAHKNYTLRECLITHLMEIVNNFGSILEQNIAKRSNSNDDWNPYRRIKNSVNSKIKIAHKNYFKRMFDNSFNGNHKQLWKYIRAKRKDHQNISTLIVDGETISDPESKANALNNYFSPRKIYQILIPSMNECNNPEDSLPPMPSITFSVDGIQHQLSLLDTNKTSGPDVNIHPYILKNCANEIAPILQVIFTQSLDTAILPSQWLMANVCPVFKKRISY